MKILTIDTCAEPSSIAIQVDGAAPEVIALPQGWRSSMVQEEITKLLSRHGMHSKDIDGYGVTTGPGTFTGVRIGLTVVKALAEVHQKPIIPMSTLELIALAARNADKEHTRFAAVMDARRGQVFGAAYEMNGEEVRVAVEETVGSLANFLERVREQGLQDACVCGVDLTAYLPELEKQGWKDCNTITVAAQLAGILAEETAVRLKRGEGKSPLEVDANYVRASDAEKFWSA